MLRILLLAECIQSNCGPAEVRPICAAACLGMPFLPSSSTQLTLVAAPVRPHHCVIPFVAKHAEPEVSPCRIVAACGGSDGGAPLALFCMCAACTHALSAITHVWPDSHSLVSLHIHFALACTPCWIFTMYCRTLAGLSHTGEGLHACVPFRVLAPPVRMIVLSHV